MIVSVPLVSVPVNVGVQEPLTSVQGWKVSPPPEKVMVPVGVGSVPVPLPATAPLMLKA